MKAKRLKRQDNIYTRLDTKSDALKKLSISLINIAFIQFIPRFELNPKLLTTKMMDCKDYYSLVKTFVLSFSLNSNEAQNKGQ